MKAACEVATVVEEFEGRHVRKHSVPAAQAASSATELRVVACLWVPACARTPADKTKERIHKCRVAASAYDAAGGPHLRPNAHHLRAPHGTYIECFTTPPVVQSNVSISRVVSTSTVFGQSIVSQ